MSNIFKVAGERIKNSPAIIVIWIAVLAFAIVCGSLLFEAYMTSVLGYQMIPTRKTNPELIYMVGLLPILGQIVFAYAYLSNTSRGYAGWIVFVLHIVDMTTDIVFKVNGNFSIGLIIIAFIESEILYTIGAIMGFTFALGTLLEITPDALHALNDIFRGVVHASGVVDSEKDPDLLSTRGNRP